MTTTNIDEQIQQAIDLVAPQIQSQLNQHGFQNNAIFITERPVFRETTSNDLFLLDVRVEGMWCAHVVPCWLAADWSLIDEEDIDEQGGIPVVIQFEDANWLTGFSLRKVED